MRSARRARLVLDGRRFARLASAFSLHDLPVRLGSMARSSRALATSARRRRRQARNLEASGQTNQASAPAPREEKRSAASVLDAVPGATDDDRRKGDGVPKPSSAHPDL